MRKPIKAWLNTLYGDENEPPPTYQRVRRMFAVDISKTTQEKLLRRLEIENFELQQFERRGSSLMASRWHSLIDFIPGWPQLQKPKDLKQDFWRDGAEDVTARDQDSRAELSARFSKGNVKVRWFKGDMEIFHGEKYNFLMDDEGVVRLIIQRIIKDDEGRYTCVINDASTSAYLTVEENIPTDHHDGVNFPTVELVTCNLLPKRKTKIGKQNTKVALLILMQIFLHSMAITEKQMNKYVVREGSSFAMDCKHELQNIKVVLWEFVSNHNNRYEVIYDSQSIKFLKPGFEVSCEPQQTFISTCIIKITQTKTDDSGKYICYVGETEGKDAMLEAVVEIELVIRGPKHQTMVVNNGDSVILPCEHNITNLTRARWSHVSLQGVMTYQLYYMDWTEATNNNYEGLCKSHQLSCNLKILQANKESAGRYICMVGEPLEFEKKYGLDQMTYFVEIQLVVGELQCNENMNKNLTLIGENDCYGIEADVLNLKCSFNYFGNINYSFLHLRWIEKYKFNSLEKKLNSSLINHEVKDGTNKISIQTNLSVAYEMQNSTFQCVLENSFVKPCHLHEFKVQYIKNTTKRLPPMHSNDLHNIKCSANKSSNVQCSYYWVHEIGGALVENPYAILPVENMNSPGNYTCIGKCHLGRNDCIIKAMEFEILQERTEISIVILSMISGLLAFVVVVLISLFLRGRFYKPRTDQDPQLLGSEKPPS